MGRQGAAWLCGWLLLLAPHAFSYEGSDHQFLTFLAAKQFNRCVEGSDVPPLTPLEVRYMARANAGLVERSVLARMFNWRYYNRADQAPRSVMWLVETRLHAHFDELADRLREIDDRMAAYQDLGRLLSYVQMVTSPARAVPVYGARFWRFSFADRFDGYRVDEEALAAAVEADCAFLDSVPASYDDVLAAAADRTLAALSEPIEGLPAEWTAFWMPSADPGSFGDYGPAGNSFGRRTEFRCGNGERCVLLADDPLYRDFALARHRDAVRATQSAMLIMQTRVRDSVASAH